MLTLCISCRNCFCKVHGTLQTQSTYICHMLRACCVFVYHNLSLGFVTRLTRVSLVEQELLSKPYPFRPPEFTPGFQWGLYYSIFSFMDRCLSFFLWPLCCLSFFDLRILISPLVFSKSSYIQHKKQKVTELVLCIGETRFYFDNAQGYFLWCLLLHQKMLYLIS